MRKPGSASAAKLQSYFEIEICKDKINILERAGDGKTEEIVSRLESYGLKLTVCVSAPCG
ncbi:MAG: hypothetical protein ACOYEQ_02010 [Bacillota bacterium]|jgi:hypothetical protein